MCSRYVSRSASTASLINMVRQADSDGSGVLASIGSVESFTREQPIVWDMPFDLELGQTLKHVLPQGATELTLSCVSHNQRIKNVIRLGLEHEARMSDVDAEREKRNNPHFKPYSTDFEPYSFEKEQLFDCVVVSKFFHWELYSRPVSERINGTHRRYVRIGMSRTSSLCGIYVSSAKEEDVPTGIASGIVHSSYRTMQLGSQYATMGRYDLIQNNCQDFITELLKRMRAFDLASKLKSLASRLGLRSQRKHVNAKNDDPVRSRFSGLRTLFGRMTR